MTQNDRYVGRSFTGKSKIVSPSFPTLKVTAIEVLKALPTNYLGQCQGMRRVTPLNNHGSIRIRFTHQGHRYSLSPGGHFDDRPSLPDIRL
jgi:hypothetical protein